jgi:hypothetical protein
MIIFNRSADLGFLSYVHLWAAHRLGSRTQQMMEKSSVGRWRERQERQEYTVGNRQQIMHRRQRPATIKVQTTYDQERRQQKIFRTKMMTRSWKSSEVTNASNSATS